MMDAGSTVQFFDSYTLKKIEHMRRMGLVAPKSTGYGIYGGAAPDWLNERRKALERATARRLAARAA